MDGPGHRAFLAAFYRGDAPGSFARGADFQVNEATGDRRTNGSFASLAGLEAALEAGDEEAANLAADRIRLGHALIAGYGGVPLIYMGDEVGLTNDRSYESDPARAADGRWMQRPRMDWDAATGDTLRARMSQRILDDTRHVMSRRKATPALSGMAPTQVLRVADGLVFALVRDADEGRLTAVHGFNAAPHEVALSDLGLDPDRAWHDALADAPAHVVSGRVQLPRYGIVWLVERQ